LVTIVGANTGDACMVDCDLSEHYVCQSVAFLRPVLSETSKYLELFLNSSTHGRAEYLKWSYGEGRPHLSFDHLRETVISLPPLDEQQEIVHRVSQLFTLADQIEARYLKAKTHVDRLTQSILAKAFRGELVSQDPNDEPAEMLLARLKAQPADAATSKRRGRPKKAGG
jgi:type I restriction enzyme S subunit